MEKRVTRKELAVALSKRLGLSVNMCNSYLLDLIIYVNSSIYDGDSVKLFGICKMYRKDGKEFNNITTAFLSNNFKDTQKALAMENELSRLILDFLNSGFRVVLTGLVSFKKEGDKIKCASSSTLRGDRACPVRVSLDKNFKEYSKMSEVL